MQRIDHEGMSAALLRFYDLPADTIPSTELFQTWTLSQSYTGSSPSLHRTSLLASIPEPIFPSHRPLQLLYLLLLQVPGPWPTFELIKHHTRILKYLPEDRSEETAWLVDVTQKMIKSSYQSLAQFIKPSHQPALRSTSPKNFITHHGLSSFIYNFALPLPINPDTRKPIVSIALPNGPLMAAVCMAVTTYYIAAPVNPAAGSEQFKSDILQGGASCILTTAQEYQSLHLSDPWVAEAGITIIFVEWTHTDDITLYSNDSKALRYQDVCQPNPNTADDIALILFTSGTSGSKKVVPLTTHSILAGIAFVIESWGLQPSDTCLNMMPLYHVGGLVRNIFAPVFSGGATVCCAAFDPTLFWDVIETIRPTWYYASPSMHSLILAGARPEALAASRIRLVCNAAGGLLPSLACQLRDTFKSIVLPSYGMTECMPISTPPLDYQLDRAGTSGISTGPDLTILNWSDTQPPNGTVGRICVRGEPVFPGYLCPDGTIDTSCFTSRGWFDTGDLGYMDADGYLYITGRSKEVINRGGELISPFEVENAIMAASRLDGSPLAGRVTQALAFSVPHDVLQEVVAVALVTPPHQHRVDLRIVHAALRSSLQQAKWPLVIVYMDDLPKNNNKVLRIKLAERLDMSEVTNDTSYLDRHWEAVCPPPDTPLSVKIPASRCRLDHDDITRCLRSVIPSGFDVHLRVPEGDGALELYLAPRMHGTDALEPDWATHAKRLLAQQLNGYLVPGRVCLMQAPFPRTNFGSIDDAMLQVALEEQQAASSGGSIAGRVARVFAGILSCDVADIDTSVDFFALGGDSLRAGKLLSAIRAEFGVQLPIAVVFSQGTVKAIAAKLDEMAKKSADQQQQQPLGSGGYGLDGAAALACGEARDSARPLLMLTQLLPLVVFYPMRRGFQWTIFLAGMSVSQSWATNASVAGRLFNLVLCILFARLCVRLVAPWVGILAKWAIIGTYREGIYPMWGAYHTRWWLVQKIVSLCGRGFFDINDTMASIYYRLMGAKIGQGVKFAGAQLGEYDLLDIRDGVTLSKCVCRPFAGEMGTAMYLGRIVIGENASIGLASIIAPGTVVPANTCMGPNSSSWELDDADEAFRDQEAQRAPKPHILLTIFVTYPLALIGWFLALTPWIAGLIGMVISQPLDSRSPMRDILKWFATPHRVAWHYLALVLRVMFSPFILFGFAWLVKCVLDRLYGKMGPSPAHGRGNIDIWRGHLMKTMLPVSRLHDMTGMFGQHYEATSVAMRMMGARVGQRVYWPGTGPSIGDYHLLNVGDDVVFGSRAHIVTSDGIGAETVTIRDGAMIADRVTLLPGVEVCEKTTMGSGALTRRGKRYAPGDTYVGSKAGDAVCLTTGSSRTATRVGEARRRPPIPHAASEVTLVDPQNSDPHGHDMKKKIEEHFNEVQVPEKRTFSPFGRAFYLKQAPYRVFGPFVIFLYSTFLTVFTAFFWNVPNISSIMIVDRVLRFRVDSVNTAHDVLIVWGMVTVCIAVLTTLHAIVALAVVIGAKWALLGRRVPGNYDWDKSPYCQRWQLFLSIERLRRHCYRGEGILGMLTGTQWIVWYFRALGADIGANCALFANGRPSLMFTEPDLIKLGNRVVVDDASVVGHINTRGKFDLNRLAVGDGCVLRTGSRLLSGAAMRNGSCLLEHTLIMGGDVVEEGWTMQGWPAERFGGRRTSSEHDKDKDTLVGDGASYRSSDTETLADMRT
ncbi:peroxisomal-coenzyme A synthetase [Plectosphaerella plurivora]|uniref:Peroxisomal-coenzyme A synthetase n=1 Tax=Plectosphaerella plurivora TaxID=936078 RepID=A0A9P8VHT4_9PEZI|nr:peroxisomal-coenzyme A synthetase [Plectosphaerella plurivora]